MRPRMCLIDLLELLEGGVRVAYGRGDGVMPHQLTQEHEISTRVQHVGSEGVPQDVSATTSQVGHCG